MLKDFSFVKSKKFVLIIVFVVLLIVALIIFLNIKKTDTSKMTNGVGVFKYEDVNISEKLSDEDMETIRDIFDNKWLHHDNPSCGFNEDVSVVFDKTHVFCIACDTCPIIYYKNKDMYFNLSEVENKLLRNILKQYGFKFPCV